MHEKQEQSTAPPGAVSGALVAAHEQGRQTGMSAPPLDAAAEQRTEARGTPAPYNAAAAHAAGTAALPGAAAAKDDAHAWRERAENAERELVFRRAVESVDWFDADDAFREVVRRARRDENGAWVVDVPEGSRQETVSGAHSQATVGGAPSPRDPGATTPRLLTPLEAVRELAARKPHWVRAKIIAGTGAGSGQVSATFGGGVTYAELLKPENRDKLADYLHNRPQELERLRQGHFKR